MKVLQINAVDSIGSTGTIMSDIQDVCTHNGIECHIAYAVSQRHKSEILNGYHIGNWFDHKLHALLWRITKRQGYFSTISTWFFLRHISKLQPDVVHLHNLHSNYINLNMLLRYLAKHDIPTVVTLHDSWFYTGECYLPEITNCKEWKCGCKNCPLHQQKLSRLTAHVPSQVYKERKKLFNTISRLTIVGVSDWTSLEAKQSFLSGANILTIRNGVRTDVFSPMQYEARRELRKKYGITDSHFVILAPASKWLNDENSEGLQILLESLHDDEKLVVYGCNKKEYQKAKAIINVIPIPFVRNKVVLSTIYSIADVFINCTHMDTCSFINIEAQACGVPTVTFNNTGAAETVDNINSFIVPNGDFNAIVVKIKEIKQKGRSNPVKWVTDNFSMYNNYMKYVEVYKSFMH